MATYHFETKPHGNMRSGRKLNTVCHYDYINRQGNYDKKEDLVFATSGNIPGWAKDAHDFWEEAEKQRYKGSQYTGKDGLVHRTPEGRAYRDFIMSLPEEKGFTNQDYIAMVEDFLAQYRISKEHAYSYAIHNKPASLDPSHRNVHVHVMMDERIIEKDRKVERNKYFKVYRENGKGEAIGGYKKDRTYHSREMLLNMRKTWEKILNDKYAEKGMDIRVTADSLQTQRTNLLLEGKYEEAETLSYPVAPHLGSSLYRNKNALRLIRDISDDIKRVTDEGKRYEIPDNLDPDIKKIYVYGYAIAIKKAAKELQQLRLDAQKKKLDEERMQLALQIEAEEEDRYEQLQRDLAEDFHEQDPLFVTCGNLVDFCAAKATLEKQKAEDAKEKYVSVKKQLRTVEKLTEKDYDRKAEDLLFDGASLRAKKEYKAVVDKLQQGGRLPVSEFEKLVHLRTHWGKKVSYYKHQMSLHKKEFNQLKYNLMQEKNELLDKQKEYYKTYKTYEKLAAQHDDLAETLTSAYDYNEILYKDKVPGMLNKRCKINGMIPLERLPRKRIGDYTFYFFNEEGEIPTKEEMENGSLKAVIENSDINKGTVKTYDVVLENGGMVGIEEAKERTPLYKPHPQFDKAERKQDYKDKKFSKNLLKNALKKFNLINPVNSRKLSTILNKLTEEKQSIINVDPYYESQRKIEKLKEATNELERVEALMTDVFER